MTSIRVRYQTVEFGDVDIHIRSLRDSQQFYDAEGIAEKLGISSASWPIFGIVWGSGEVLARYLYDIDIAGRRVLEVGCGIGLASLLLNHRGADITATDYHPEAGNFLAENARLNGDRDIPFLRTGWADDDGALGLFDLIVGSDLLYEAEHVDLLSKFIDRHARPRCEVIIVDPGRGNHARFSKRMVALGYVHTQALSVHGAALNPPLRAQVLRYIRSSPQEVY
ncbi:MAG: histidine kinase [unclassified Hahellaceae]|nr:histidine kinase [Hahellaceae bacterium]|tara:strand:- start:9956 stop:10627 length:672 start_codon:yes stop_codon:yes gene_type:complete